MKVCRKIAARLTAKSGQTVTEYALIMAFVVIVLAALYDDLATPLKGFLETTIGYL